jgi:hypothetical protein
MPEAISDELFSKIHKMESAVTEVLGDPSLPPRLHDKMYAVWLVVSGSDFGFNTVDEILDDGDEDGPPLAA